MTRLLVDTPALLWWLTDDAGLSDTARAALADPANDVLVSTASVWEIAIKRGLGKLARRTTSRTTSRRRASIGCRSGPSTPGGYGTCHRITVIPSTACSSRKPCPSGRRSSRPTRASPPTRRRDLVVIRSGSVPRAHARHPDHGPVPPRFRARARRRRRARGLASDDAGRGGRGRRPRRRRRLPRGAADPRPVPGQAAAPSSRAARGRASQRPGRCGRAPATASPPLHARRLRRGRRAPPWRPSRSPTRSTSPKVPG